VRKVQQVVDEHRIQNDGDYCIEKMQFADQVPVEDGESGRFGRVENEQIEQFQLHLCTFRTTESAQYMLIRLIDCIGHLGRLDIGPRDNSEELKRSDQTKHDLKNQDSSVDAEVEHQTGDGYGIHEICPEQSTPEAIRLDQFVLQQIVLNQDGVQTHRISSSAVVRVQSSAHFDEFEPEVVGQVREEQRQKADDTGEQIGKVDHQETFGQIESEINGAVRRVGVQSLVCQVRGEGRAKVRHEIVQNATGTVEVMDEQHLSTHFAVREAEKSVTVAIQVFGNVQPILKTNIVIESVTVDVGEAEHAMEADPHAQEHDSYTVEHESKVDKVRLIPRRSVDKKKCNAIQDDDAGDQLHQFRLVIGEIATYHKTAVAILPVQKTHFFKQRNERQ
jgi:hypothetical protein